MKKILTIASLALIVAGAAFAGVGEEGLFVQPNATFSTTVNPANANYLLTGPTTTNNDDSCDISVMPAATLLLPYFEVDFRSPSTSARNTVFTITNTSPQPQIAHITIWTDWSFPVIDFNIWLTGYDVQPISLYEIIRNGQIPVTGYAVSNIGSLSADVVIDNPATPTVIDPLYVGGNPNIDPSEATGVNNPLSGCDVLPGPIPSQLVTDMQNALTAGQYSSCSGLVGGNNANAVGYLTVDVAARCSQLLPTDPRFFNNDINFDNVLIGDYQIINPATGIGNWAGGESMVHIRAIPEGGPHLNTFGDNGFGLPRGTTTTNFNYTFYDRYTIANANTPGMVREADRRQPLPGVFAARYIDDVPTGPTGFETNLAIWREGRVTGNRGCGVFDTAGRSYYGFNRAIPTTRFVRFDEQENPNIISGCRISPCPGESSYTTEETSSLPVDNPSFFPGDFTGTADLGGWMYLNFNNTGCNSILNADVPQTPCTDRVSPIAGAPNASQAWVVVNMAAEGRYAVSFDAAALGNGCSMGQPGTPIGPAPNVTPQVDAVP